MEIHSVHFGRSEFYKRYARVLEKSIERNSPNTPLTIYSACGLDDSITNCLRHGKASGHEISNAFKTKFHNEIVQCGGGGDLIGLFDLDLMILQDLTPIEKEDFDIAFTVRNHTARINTGVVFVRVSAKTKRWYDKWYRIVQNLLKNNGLRNELRMIHQGINQSALSIMMKESHNLKILELPGPIWNCTSIDFPLFGPNTKIVHMLGEARRAITELKDPKEANAHRIVKLWKSFEIEGE